MTPETLAALLERVKAATGPDRELDLAIGIAIGGWSIGDVDGHSGLVHVPEDACWYVPRPGGGYPHLTASLDAAVALCERQVGGSYAQDLILKAVSDWRFNRDPFASLPLRINEKTLTALIQKADKP